MSAALNNRANQLNPNNWRYWKSRGYSGIPSGGGGSRSTCLMLKKILLFSFTLIRWTLNLILHVLSFFLCTCVGWILIVICAAIGTFIYFYYYYFNCQGQIFRLEFNCTVPANFTIDLPPVNITALRKTLFGTIKNLYNTNHSKELIL